MSRAAQNGASGKPEVVCTRVYAMHAQCTT